VSADKTLSWSYTEEFPSEDEQIADAIESVMDLGDAEYEAMSRDAHATWAEMSDAQRQYREFVDGLIALEG